MTDMRKLSAFWAWGVAGATAAFLLLNFFVWFYNLNLLFMPYPNCGDLARIGMAPEIGQCREEKRTLPKLLQNPTPQDPTTFPILSFGDSISRGRGGGENNYWQDFVATRSGLDIAWVSEIDDNNYPQDIIRLRNSGYLKKHQVKYLVVQAAERAAINRFSKNVNWDETMPLSELEDRLYRLSGMLFTDERHIQAWDGQKLARFGANRELEARAMLTQFVFMHATSLISNIDKIYQWIAEHFQYTPEITNDRPVLHLIAIIFAIDEVISKLPWDARISFLADGVRTQMPAAINNNYKWLQRKISNMIGMDKFTEAAQRLKLDRAMFDGPYGNTLMFHLGDYKINRKNRDDAPFFKMHENLNQLADLLAKDGIKLYFMPTPNKLTVYQDYLAEPIDTKSTFYPRLRELPDKKYIFIDSERVISDMVAKGEQDVYFIDDTHWSSKALPAIAELFKFE